ncbi:hypothetical protein GGP41_003345 [Bipolaris sorokiniana]|uniref:Cytochrome c oxidase subunit 8, mitochondrial n=1 Tax=Cochliobolus sativus TaxID=45130 RepID=A0A8H5ZB22_COCSA|nr:hypothetical protein GGP41_003345 [Bipolaris sorokiniana]
MAMGAIKKVARTDLFCQDMCVWVGKLLSSNHRDDNSATSPLHNTAKMLARATFRAASAPTLVARRGFQSTRAQFSSPYHYPEGPRSNLPFDPLKKGFAFKYWGFMATGFSLPFLLAGTISHSVDMGLGHARDTMPVEYWAALLVTV